MNNVRKTISILVKAMFVLALFSLTPFHSASAQTQKKKSAPRFVGSLPERTATFVSFIDKNVGSAKPVYLKITFDEEPYGYKDENADPFFEAGNYSYYFQCGEEENAVWTKRCRILNYNPATKTISGYFFVTEPDPKTMRTNRLFVLTSAATVKN